MAITNKKNVKKASQARPQARTASKGASSKKTTPKAKSTVKKTSSGTVTTSTKTTLSGKKSSTKKTSHVLLQPPRGMRDILPEEQPYWVHIDRVLNKCVQDFGFQRISTPIVEYANLYQRGIGEGTDIVEKEMYVFDSRGGDKLALRPEMTAGIVRSFIQNGMHLLPKPIKLFSSGPVFRYERPQEGRYRQHHQANFDIFGEKDPILDAQLVQMAYRVLTALGLKNIQFNVNSLGSLEDKKEYQKLLVSYLKSRRAKLCMDCKRRIDINPLRVLDCKEETCQQVASGVPQMVDQLSAEAHSHFKHLLEYLDELEVPYEIDPSLVRGLDYYTHTVFEATATDGSGKRGSLGGGGRYDGLIKLLGGEDTPAIGVGLGLERIVAQMMKEKTKIYTEPKPRVFLAQLGELAKKKSLKLFAHLEKEGVLLAESFGRGSLKSQLRQAQKLGVDVTVILGQKETIDETVIIKDMASGSQETVSQEKMVALVKKLLKDGKLGR